MKNVQLYFSNFIQIDEVCNLKRRWQVLQTLPSQKKLLTLNF